MKIYQLSVEYDKHIAALPGLNVLYAEYVNPDLKRPERSDSIQSVERLQNQCLNARQSTTKNGNSNLI
jgi:outer membrane cobalamin receptor